MQTDPKQAGGWIAARTAPVELASFLDDWAIGPPRGQRRREGRCADWWRRPAPPTPTPGATPSAPASGQRAPTPSRPSTSWPADEKALETQPAESLRLLALRLKAAGDREAAARVLRRAWRLRPDDFWVNFDLATLARGRVRASPRSSIHGRRRRCGT